VNPPFRFSAASAAARSYVRTLGADSEAILGELGYTRSAIAALVEAGVTVSAPG
jgi:crotonobetainyl-CoA:carnitine CoA-transferase CaiB-like acyl-CoA transferase